MMTFFYSKTQLIRRAESRCDSLPGNFFPVIQTLSYELIFHSLGLDSVPLCEVGLQLSVTHVALIAFSLSQVRKTEGMLASLWQM